MDGGVVTMNGVTDAELIKILEAKAKAGAVVGFQPNVMQPVQRAGAQPTSYNNVVLTWQGAETIKTVIDILSAAASS